jgi:cytochrome c-type biogenesis protein CcmH
MKRAIWLFGFLMALALAAIPKTALAQDPTPQPTPQATPSDDEVNAIAKTLYCPVCENIPLDVCPTLACERWRQQIREKLALGWDEEQIRDYFILQYGDRVVDEPPRRGLNWLAYIVPPAVFIVGAYVVYRVLQSRLRTAEAVEGTPGPPPPQGDEYTARLEEELERRQ